MSKPRLAEILDVEKADFVRRGHGGIAEQSWVLKKHLTKRVVIITRLTKRIGILMRLHRNPDAFHQKKLLADVIDKKFLLPKKD